MNTIASEPILTVDEDSNFFISPRYISFALEKSSCSRHTSRGCTQEITTGRFLTCRKKGRLPRPEQQTLGRNKLQYPGGSRPRCRALESECSFRSSRQRTNPAADQLQIRSGPAPIEHPRMHWISHRRLELLTGTRRGAVRWNFHATHHRQTGSAGPLQDNMNF